jgi:hypothetical protein
MIKFDIKNQNNKYLRIKGVLIYSLYFKIDVVRTINLIKHYKLKCLTNKRSNIDRRMDLGATISSQLTDMSHN